MKIKSKWFLLISILGVVLLLIYLLWRAIFTIPMPAQYGWVAFICGVGLLLAEAFSVYEAILSYVDLNLAYQPEMPVIPDEMFPEVDVMIATHNEEVDLLFKTANACRMLRYPDKSKVHVWICDDGNRREVEDLANRLGVGYIGLADNKFAKAGNLNNALSKTHAPLIATFDADMIPNSEFLLETVPYFFLPVMKKNKDGVWVKKEANEIDSKEKIGFIQTPQSFYNPDLFQYNLYSSNNIPNEQDYFFRQVNLGKNRTNSSIYAGSNTVISREALDEVGGIATGTITEDFETGLLIESKGYRCYAIDKLLAKGLAPISIPALIKQRERWARGCIYSLRRIRLWFNPNIKFSLKLSYWACRLYWQSFTRRLFYIFAPLLFAILGIPVVVCGLKEILLIWLPAYLIYTYTLKKISGDIRNTRWSNIVDTIMFPYLLIPIWMETLGIRKKEFSITNKSKKAIEETPKYMVLPHLFLFALSVVALIFSINDIIANHSLGTLVVIYWIIQNGLNLLMAIFFMTGRNNERLTERLEVRLPIEVDYEDRTLEGTVVDISEGGFAFVLNEAVYLPYKEGEEAEFIIRDRDYVARVTGRIATVKELRDSDSSKWKYCICITGMDEENKEQYSQIIFDREHTLPKTLSKRSSYIGDVINNIEMRIGRSRVSSARHTPRIKANEKVVLESGEEVLVEDFSFEYVRLNFAANGESKDSLISFPKKIVLFPQESYRMVCVPSGFNQNIYRIDNFRELERTNSWEGKIKEWERNNKKRKKNRKQR